MLHFCLKIRKLKMQELNFICSPYSLGNYLMLMRTPVLLHGSILNTLWAVVLGSLLILVSVVIGSITIEKKDIYS